MIPEYVVIHCSASRWGDAEEIHDWHRKRGWRRIGYHYVVLNGYTQSGDRDRNAADDGRIELGRPEVEHGAHAEGYNDRSIGICLVGRGLHDFSVTQRATAMMLCASLLLRYGLDSSAILGHDETKGIKYGGTRLPTDGPPCPNMCMDEFRFGVTSLLTEAWNAV